MIVHSYGLDNETPLRLAPVSWIGMNQAWQIFETLYDANWLKWFGDGYDLVRCNLGYLASLAVGVTENAEEEFLVMAL